jgi:hypothetical protein
LLEKWYFEHNDFECPKCNGFKNSYALNFYISDKDSHKYECSNEKCNYVEIKTLKEMMKEVGL